MRPLDDIQRDVTGPWAHRAHQLIEFDIPALVARVRDLEATIARVRNVAECPHCAGYGYFVVTIRVEDGRHKRERQPCPACGGLRAALETIDTVASRARDLEATIARVRKVSECPRCDGDGTHGYAATNEPCPECGGLRAALDGADTAPDAEGAKETRK